MTNTEEGTPQFNSLVQLIQKIFLSPNQFPIPTNLEHYSCNLKLHRCSSFQNTPTDLYPERHTWPMPDDHCPTLHIPSKDLESVSRKAESSSVIFTQLSQSFPRAWNAINTAVKSTVVCSEVSQGFGYLTYKQLFPTNANRHWDWELVDTSETNLPFGLAWNTNVSLFGLPCQLQPPVTWLYSHGQQAHFSLCNSVLFYYFSPEVLLYYTFLFL